MSGSVGNPSVIGERYDADLELYYLRARWYNQGTGRFLTRDTYPSDVQNPIELNRYVYTANNPVHAVDSSGLNTFAGRMLMRASSLISAAQLTAVGLSVACIYRLTHSFLKTALELALFGGTFTYDATTPPCTVQRKPATCDDDPYNQYVKCSKLWAYHFGTLQTAHQEVLADMRTQGYNTRGVSLKNVRTANSGPCAGRPGALHAVSKRGNKVCASRGECTCCEMQGSRPVLRTMCRIFSTSYDYCR